MMKQSAGVASFFLNSSIFISPVMAGEKIAPEFCARQEVTLERVCAINSGPGIWARCMLDVRIGALTAAQRHRFTTWSDSGARRGADTPSAASIRVTGGSHD